MKKADMLVNLEKLLKNIIEGSNTRNSMENITSYCQRSAIKILLTLEKQGMTPPRLPEEYCQALMTLYYAGYTTHQWEEAIEKNEKVMEALERREKARQERKERLKERKT